jgi:hypothetical protein
MSLFRQLMRALEAPIPQRDPDPRLSVAVLLVEAARQDDIFEPRERMVIEQLLARKFDLKSAWRWWKRPSAASRRWCRSTATRAKCSRTPIRPSASS